MQSRKEQFSSPGETSGIGLELANQSRRRIGNNLGALYQQRYWHNREFETVSQLGEIAKTRGVPLTTLSVAWVLANPTITTVILGASRLQQLNGSLAAANYAIDPELKEQLDELTAAYRCGDADRKNGRHQFTCLNREFGPTSGVLHMSRRMMATGRISQPTTAYQQRATQLR